MVELGRQKRSRASCKLLLKKSKRLQRHTKHRSTYFDHRFVEHWGRNYKSSLHLSLGCRKLVFVCGEVRLGETANCYISVHLSRQNRYHSIVPKRHWSPNIWIRRFSKYVRSFSDVPQLPDRWHRYHLVIGHWLSVYNWVFWTIDLAIGAPRVWKWSAC